MKTLGRILVIVLAACAISGATYALAQTGLLPTSMIGGGFEGQRGEGGEFANAPAGQDAAGVRQRPAGAERGGDRRGGGIAGLAVVGKNTVMMAIVILVGAVGVRLLQNRKRPVRLAAK